MTDLFPAAQAVLTALTQQEYDLDPADISNEAGRMACIAAAALRAAADQVVPSSPAMSSSLMMVRHQLLTIAAELEGQ